MSIGFRNSSQADISAPGTTVTISKPSGTASTDILILIFACGRTAGGASGTYTSPSGWSAISTHFNQTGGGGTSVDLAGFWSLGSNANLGFTKSGTVDFGGWICLAFTGVDNTTPIDATGTTNNNTGASSLTTNAVTIATSDAWHCIGFTDANDGAFSATNFTNTENNHVNQAAGCLNRRTGLSIGTTGTVSVTSSASSTNQILLAMPFALRPADSYPVQFVKNIGDSYLKTLIRM